MTARNNFLTIAATLLTLYTTLYTQDFALGGTGSSRPITEEEIQSAIDSSRMSRLRLRYGEKVLTPQESEIKYPAISSFVTDIFEHLTQPLNMPPHNGGPDHPVKQTFGAFYIAESEVANAEVFELTTNTGKVDEIEFGVLITTGLLKRLFDLPPAGTGVERLMGVLAHEIAHRSKYLKAVPPRWPGLLEKTIATQKEEARADVVAIDILHQAGYPIEGIIKAHDILTAGAGHRSSEVIDAMFELLSSHPQGSLRSSYTRIAAVVDRFGRGEVVPFHKTYPNLSR